MGSSPGRPTAARQVCEGIPARPGLAARHALREDMLARGRRALSPLKKFKLTWPRRSVAGSTASQNSRLL